MNKTPTNSRFKSLNNIRSILNGKLFYYNNDNNDSIKTGEQLSLTRDDINNRNDRIDIFNSIFQNHDIKNKFNQGNNIKKRNFPKNNYSVSNIPDIKIKKMILPDSLTKRNTNIIPQNSFLSDHENIQNKTNNKSLSPRLKDGTYRKGRCFDISKINKRKNDKIKNKRFPKSAKTIDRRIEYKIKENIKSLLVTNIKKQRNTFNNLINLKKGEKEKSSFEKKNNKKDENILISSRKTYYDKKNFKELILKNSKKL